MRYGSMVERKKAVRAAELLLRDEQHRTANELAVALAGLRSAIRTEPADLDLLRRVMERLDLFAKIRRIISTPEHAGGDMIAQLEELLRCMSFDRDEWPVCFSTSTLRLHLYQDLARTILRVVHEMLTNAFRHGVAGQPISLAIKATKTRIEIRCVNACHREAKSKRAGSGTGILQALCTGHGGSFASRTSKCRWVVRAVLPRSPRPEV